MDEQKIEVNDIVKINESLVTDNHNGPNNTIPINMAMTNYKGRLGKVVVVREMDAERTYILDVDEAKFLWTDRMVKLYHKAEKIEKSGSTKPPLGITPEHLWLEKRVKDLADTITRHSTAGYTIDQAWVEEYNRHIMKLTTMPHSIYYTPPTQTKITEEQIQNMVRETPVMVVKHS